MVVKVLYKYYDGSYWKVFQSTSCMDSFKFSELVYSRGGKAMMVPHFLQKGQKTSLNKQTVPETEATIDSAESSVKIDN